jgi:hypothetical protein
MKIFQKRYRKNIELAIVCSALIFLLIFPVVAQYIPVYPLPQQIFFFPGYQGIVQQARFVWRGFLRYPDLVPVFYTPYGIIQEAKATFFNVFILGQPFYLTSDKFFKGGYLAEVDCCGVTVYGKVGSPTGYAEFSGWQTLPPGTKLQVTEEIHAWACPTRVVLDDEYCTCGFGGCSQHFDPINSQVKQSFSRLMIWAYPSSRIGYSFDSWHYLSVLAVNPQNQPSNKPVKIYFDEKLIHDGTITNPVEKNLLPYIARDEDKKFVLKAYTQENAVVDTEVSLKWLINLAKIKVSSKVPVNAKTFDSLSGEKLDEKSGNDVLMNCSQKVDMIIEDPGQKYRIIAYEVNVTKSPEINFEIKRREEKNKIIYELNLKAEKESMQIELDYGNLEEKYITLKKCEDSLCKKIPFTLNAKENKVVFKTAGASKFIISEEKKRFPLLLILLALIIVLVGIFIMLKKLKKPKPVEK